MHITMNLTWKCCTEAKNWYINLIILFTSGAPGSILNQSLIIAEDGTISAAGNV